MKQQAAFFDIDGTLYREALITQMFKKMILSDMIDSNIYHTEVKGLYRKWRRRQGDYDDYLIKMAEIYMDAIKGFHHAQITYIAKKVVEQYGEHVYTFTRDRIKWHKEQNHTVIAISGAPYELVEAMARKYGFDDFIGTKYHLDQNQIYTGEFEPMWDSHNKKEAIDKFLATYDISLKASYAYGDTNGDFDMLKSVGNPVAINPTKELIHRLANDRDTIDKIKIVVERKDMVYELNADYITSIERE